MKTATLTRLESRLDALPTPVGLLSFHSRFNALHSSAASLPPTSPLNAAVGSPCCIETAALK